jgi:hypothetical protein
MSVPNVYVDKDIGLALVNRILEKRAAELKELFGYDGGPPSDEVWDYLFEPITADKYGPFRIRSDAELAERRIMLRKH